MSSTSVVIKMLVKPIKMNLIKHLFSSIVKVTSLLSLTISLQVSAVQNVGKKPKDSQILKFAVIGISGQQREVLLSLAYDFEQKNKETYVRYMFLEDATLKQEIHDWMRGNKKVDLVLWQAGERLFQFVRQNQVEKLDGFWQRHNLDENYPASIKPLVQNQGHTYAIPISYYNWGFYYNRSVFQKLNVQPPSDWSSFMDMVGKLKKNGIDPLSITSKEKWPVSAWFEYINLRVNGLDYHQRFMKGQVAFDSDKVKDVLNKWKEVLDASDYKQHHKVLLWRDSLPDLLREKSGVALMGNFMTQLIPAHLDGKISYFPFPEIDPNVPQYELAPTDVLMIPATAKNKDLAYKYMDFLVDPVNQSFLNAGFKQFALHRGAKNPEREIMQKGLANLLKANGLTQYLDRDSSESRASELFDVWIEFIDSRDVESAMNKMEDIRKKYTAYE